MIQIRSCLTAPTAPTPACASAPRRGRARALPAALAALALGFTSALPSFAQAPATPGIPAAPAGGVLSEDLPGAPVVPPHQTGEPEKTPTKAHQGLSAFAHGVRDIVLRQGRTAVRGRDLSNRRFHVRDDLKIQVDLYCSSWTDADRAALESLGMEIGSVATKPYVVVEGWLPASQVDALDGLAFVKEADPPAYPIANVGSVTAESDTTLGTAGVRSRLGFDGTGIRVGVISNSSSLAARNASRGTSTAGDDLPPESSIFIPVDKDASGNITYVHDGTTLPGGSPNPNNLNEGTAMMEIVHDEAPGSPLAFWGALSAVDMASGIRRLASEGGCQVIVDDMTLFSEPCFQPGVIEQAIDDVTASGVTYLTSAGNFAMLHYSGGFNGHSSNVLGFSGGNFHQFQNHTTGAYSDLLPIILPAAKVNPTTGVKTNGQATVMLQWDDPWGAANSDYDIFLTDDPNGAYYVLKGADPQTGSNNPWETIAATNSATTNTTVYLAIRKVSGYDRNLSVWVFGGAVQKDYASADHSIGFNNKAKNAVVVAAIDANTADTDSTQGSYYNHIEAFSSRGPVLISYPSGQTWNKPDISGSDGVKVTGAGGFGSPFYGTSAAAPSVAGVAAQVLSARPDLSPSTVKKLLNQNATDYGDPGFDTTFGYGLAQAGPMADASKVIYVNPQSPGATPDGLSWSTAYKRLVDAMPYARSGDQVWCAYGDYNLAPYHLPAGVQLYGGFAGVETDPSQRQPNGAYGRSIIEPSTLPGAATGSDIVIDAPISGSPTAATTVVDGFTLRNGTGTPTAGGLYGGGLYDLATTALIQNNVFDGNTADFGAGVWVATPQASVVENTFTNNTATKWGGALYVGGGNSVIIARNTILGNQAARGAGIHSNGGNPLVKDNVIARNGASDAGGGIYVWNAASPRLYNNTIAYNTAANPGAGLAVADTSNPDVVNNIIAFNGSGIHVEHSLTSVRYNDVYGNGINYDGLLDQTGQNGNVSQDPRFLGGFYAEPQRYKIQLFSPAADAGDNSIIVSGDTDHDGKPRIQPTGDNVDMGAYEIPAPKIVRVSPNGSDSNDGSSWSVPMKTVVNAVSQLNGPGEVWIAAGTYPNTHVLLPGGDRLYGGFSGTETLRRQRDWTKYTAVLDGGGSGGSVIAVARYADATTGIDGLTIQNGNASGGYGGGINVDTDASPLIQNNVVRNNQASTGGGIRLAERGAAVVRNNTIANNLASANGGGMDYYQCQPTVVGNTFSGNTANNGGAITNVQSKGYVFGNRMVGNTTNTAGTLYISGGNPTVVANTIVGNVDDGIYIESSGGRIADNNISVNTGSGLWAYQANPTVVNNTFVENGSYNGTSGSVVTNYGSNLTLTNNIIAFNAAGIQAQSGGAASFNNNDVYGNAGYQYGSWTDPTGTNGNVSVDPQIGRDANGVFHLQPASPLIGAADPTALTSDDTDIDLQARTQGGAPDIGADESDGTAWLPNATIVRVDAAAGSDGNDGSSWSKAKKTVQAGIDAAALTGGDVWVKAGTYNERINLKLGAQIYGGFAGAESARNQRNYRANPSILDGQQAGVVVTANNSLPVSTVLDGFIVRNGSSNNGGGILLNGVSVTIRNDVITKNTSGNNRGGIAIWGQSPTILANTVTGNTGFGIAMNNSGARVANNVVSINAGGGVYTYQCTARIVNNTIAENGGDGGYLADYGSNDTVTSNIIAYNASGVHSASGGSATFANNDVFGNTAYQFGAWQDQAVVSGNISADPIFARDAIGNLHIQPASPCKDAGLGSAVVSTDTDVDGQARVQGARVDIGADESDGTSYPMPNSYVVRVSSTGSDANDGSSWTSAKKTIQAGIDVAAVHGGDVWVKGGTYNEHITLKYGVQLFGGFAGTETLRQNRLPRTFITTINGSGTAGSVVTANLLQSNSTVIDGFTITGGSTDNGAGVRSDQSSATIRNNFITGNTATNAGGGVFVNAYAPLILNNTITGNTAAYGGGIDVENAAPRIANNTIAVNRGTGEGSGIRGYQSSPALVNDTIAENYGGAGIVSNYGSSFTVANTIVAFNSSGLQVVSGGGFTLKNNDTFGNQAWNVNFQDPTGTDGNISADPLLVRDGRANIQIRPGSPAINAGDSSFVLAGDTDIDGRARVIGTSVDIGAAESDGTVWPVTMRAFYVRPDGSDTNNGTTWATAKKTVQAGIEAAYAQGGEVWVKAGTYVERITMRQGVTVYGGFTGTETLRSGRNWQANRTVLDGTGSTAGPVVTSPTGISVSAAIDGFTITNGVNDNGAGVLTANSSPTFRNNLVTRNRATATVGGFWLQGGAPVLLSNVITGNSGDAVNMNSGAARLADNVISANTGVGVNIYQCNTVLTNNTIVENGSSDGGILVGYGSNATVANNIVAFNRGGIHSASGGSATFSHNDVFGNTNDSYYGWTDQTGTSGNIADDPMLARDAVGNQHIQPASPARNAGDNTAVIAGDTDVDGQVRIQDTTVDIGADESDGTAWLANGNIIRVDGAAGNDANDGSSWAAAKKTIQAAIDAATVPGGDVWVKKGTYPELITLKPAVQLYGGFAGTETARGQRDFRANRTVIDGHQAGRVVSILNGASLSTVLDGFTITGGKSDNASGVWIDHSSPTVRNNRITGNVATSSVAGIWIQNNAPLILDNIVTGNTGDGIYANSASPRIANNIVSNNTRAGIEVYQSVPTIANNTVVENGWLEGAVYIDYGSNATVANNIVAFNAAGVRSVSGGSATFLNNDVYANYAWAFNGFNDPIGKDGNIAADPKLARNADGAIHIQPSSPARDAGSSTAVVAGETDIDGQARVQGASVDMGADESDGTAWPASGIVIRVKPTGDDTKDGSSWSNARKTVQAAISAIGLSGGDVWVAAGTYNERITMKPGVQVYGGFNGTETARDQRNATTNITTLDGTGLSGSVVLANGGLSPSTVLDGLTVTNGTADSSTGNNGGGIYVAGSAPTLRNVIITGNNAPNAGGGLFITSAHNMLVAGCAITNNTSSNSGGVYIENSSNPRFADDLFTGNTGGDAGAVKLYQSGVTVANATIADNAGNGAVVADYASALTLANCIVAFNKAGVRSAGGGGITFDSDDLYGNTDWNLWAVSDPTGVNGNLSVDPLFANRSAHDYHLASASTLRDAGDDAAVLPGETDITGGTRILGAHVDLGVYESVAASPATLADAIKALKSAAGLYTPTSADFTRLNVETTTTSANRIDIRDAERLIRKALGKDPNP